MQQFYTLEQAAQALRTTVDKVKEMARRGELRAFQDRGTMRFRTQEVDEKARVLNLQSDADLPLGEAPIKSTSGSPSSSTKRRSPAPAPKEADTFGLSDDEVPLGAEPPADKTASRSGSPSSASKKKSPSPQPKKQSSVNRDPSPPPKRQSTLNREQSPSPKNPSALHREAPKASSDSDVRLVMDKSDLDFRLDLDDSAPPASPPPAPKSGPRKSKVVSGDKPDSGARILPLDADSDAKIVEDDRGADSRVPLDETDVKRPSDSDIRLEGLPGPGPDSRRDPMVTEEIDLDAESAKAPPPQPKQKPRAKSKVNPQPSAPLPTSSPFELSENDIDMDKPKGKETRPASPRTPSPSSKSLKDQEVDSSSDFELDVGTSEEHVPLDSGEVPLLSDEEVSLGELSGPSAGKSGINLDEPADSGISLEAGKSDEIEFELTLDEPQATPKPTPASEEGDEGDSSSEFELSLDDSDSPAEEDASSSDSEFELSLDVDSSAELAVARTGDEEDAPSSDSEFELTLDESGDNMEVADTSALADEEEKDIFETDFEVPALDEESGSEAVALDESDTDLESGESSDFELSLTDDEMEPDAAESDSEVVALDDEEADAGAATVAKLRQPQGKPAGKKSKLVVEEDEDLDLEVDEEPEAELDEEEDRRRPVAAAPAPPAEWGALPGVLLIFSAIFLFVGGLMGYELVQNMNAYQKSTPVTSLVVDPLARMIDENIPKD
jgi:excisionase family DNA binding protein